MCPNFGLYVRIGIGHGPNFGPISVHIGIAHVPAFISKITHQLSALGQGRQLTPIDPSYHFIGTWPKILSRFKYTAKSSQACPKCSLIFDIFLNFVPTDIRKIVKSIYFLSKSTIIQSLRYYHFYGIGAHYHVKTCRLDVLICTFANYRVSKFDVCRLTSSDVQVPKFKAQSHLRNQWSWCLG